MTSGGPPYGGPCAGSAARAPRRTTAPGRGRGSRPWGGHTALSAGDDSSQRGPAAFTAPPSHRGGNGPARLPDRGHRRQQRRSWRVLPPPQRAERRRLAGRGPPPVQRAELRRLAADAVRRQLPIGAPFRENEKNTAKNCRPAGRSRRAARAAPLGHRGGGNGPARLPHRGHRRQQRRSWRTPRPVTRRSYQRLDASTGRSGRPADAAAMGRRFRASLRQVDLGARRSASPALKTPKTVLAKSKDPAQRPVV
jgi:hypothetical protein